VHDGTVDRNYINHLESRAAAGGATGNPGGRGHIMPLPGSKW